MNRVDACPFCGSEMFIPDNDHFLCLDEYCGNTFNEEDVEFEKLRHKTSAHCSGAYATEEKPLKCDIDISMGKVVNLFHDSLAIVWFTLCGQPEPNEFDTLSVEDARSIVKGL